jgi:hypothetical protein
VTLDVDASWLPSILLYLPTRRVPLSTLDVPSKRRAWRGFLPGNACSFKIESGIGCVIEGFA